METCKVSLDISVFMAAALILPIPFEYTRFFGTPSRLACEAGHTQRTTAQQQHQLSDQFALVLDSLGLAKFFVSRSWKRLLGGTMLNSLALIYEVAWGVSGLKDYEGTGMLPTSLGFHAKLIGRNQLAW